MTKQKHPVRFWIGALGTLGLVVAPVIGTAVTMVGCTARVGPARPARRTVVVKKQPVVKKKVIVVK